jgi:hypothetical protein
VATLVTRVDAILKCDRCRQTKTVIPVDLVIAPNGTVRSKIKDLKLPEGWAEGRSGTGQQVYFCDGCTGSRVARISG